MKLSVKIALCALLVLLAAASMLAVLADLGVLPDSAGSAAPAAAEPAYELRVWDGYVALFSPPGSAAPAGTTDIRVQDLPLADRLELTGGIRVDSYERVVRLLEDLGV